MMGYWDGTLWTPHRQPLPPVPVLQPAPEFAGAPSDSAKGGRGSAPSSSASSGSTAAAKIVTEALEAWAA